ncbi:tetratricopeptide repeat protein [Porphyromonas macacae]|uniref:tetratricopeptide repeat protein n=1 Tax=Porphyromonas macacae TaxID=28115 RepID=UPI000A85A08F|nr:tetratricopeptide repeat protein [Porphyromonas macacae]
MMRYRCKLVFYLTLLVLFVLLSAAKCSHNKQERTAYEEAVALYHKGLNMDLKGEYEQALEFYNQSIEKDSSLSNTFSNRGFIWCILKDTANAIRDYFQAIKLDSNNVVALNNLGSIYGDRMEYKEAEEYFLKAIAVDSTYADSYYHYALVLFEDKKEYTNAIKFFLGFQSLEKSMKDRYKKEDIYDYMMPDYYAMRALSSYYLGICYKAIGEKKKAAFYFQEAYCNGIEEAADSLKLMQYN